MGRHLISVLIVSVSLAQAQAYAATGEEGHAYRKPAAMGLGALLGGLLAGPPGAVLGAAGGGWIGARADQKDKKIADLEQRLAGREEEFQALQARFADLQQQQGRELQRVALEKRRRALDELTAGVSLTVYFRTDSADPDPEFIPQLRHLANFLRDFPEIRLHLDGFADRRGRPGYNRKLSRRRAAAVQEVLVNSGLPAERIQQHAYGESRALAADGDTEGYAFDRRVTIQLSLDTEA